MRKIYLLAIMIAFSCSELLSQAYPDRHNTSWTDGWVSCVETDSPNVKRDPGHWIMYDFGDQYSLHKSTIWNFNVPDTTQRGMRDIVIDYSNDGQTWTEITEFEVPEAPGSAFYQGDDGPNFEGIVARYVLISILNNYGDANCVGMSELRIDATIATSTNLPDNELDLVIEASPNPASEFTNIRLSNSDSKLNYSLTDMAGKLLRQGDVTGSEFRINTSNLPSGTYSITVYNETGKKAILINVINN
ncbi:MAG: T9SS type A sorting domain-containing protein [Saprospiraceae bacterium]|nr:T9SS type A sorting domain-containing protein [Saprospiraceae bacterium]